MTLTRAHSKSVAKATIRQKTGGTYGPEAIDPAGLAGYQGQEPSRKGDDQADFEGGSEGGALEWVGDEVESEHGVGFPGEGRRPLQCGGLLR